MGTKKALPAKRPYLRRTALFILAWASLSKAAATGFVFETPTQFEWNSGPIEPDGQVIDSFTIFNEGFGGISADYFPADDHNSIVAIVDPPFFTLLFSGEGIPISGDGPFIDSLDFIGFASIQATYMGVVPNQIIENVNVQGTLLTNDAGVTAFMLLAGVAGLFAYRQRVA